MSILAIVFCIVVVVGFIAGLLESSGRSRPHETMPKGDGGGYLLDGYEPPVKVQGEGTLNVLLSAYRSLEAQRAAGFRCWIPACIERLQRGEEIGDDVALLALTYTKRELYGSRFNLDGLNEAIIALEEQMGERD